jgi:RNA-directed DNA polymerase
LLDEPAHLWIGSSRKRTRANAPRDAEAITTTGPADDGYQLTRWADDWVVTCRTRAEAEHALARAVKILEQLGVALNHAKTRIVHITRGFEFLGFKIQRGKGKFRLAHDRIKSKLNRQNLYAIPTQKSVDRFKDQIRTLTQSCVWAK